MECPEDDGCDQLMDGDDDSDNNYDDDDDGDSEEQFMSAPPKKKLNGHSISNDDENDENDDDDDDSEEQTRPAPPKKIKGPSMINPVAASFNRCLVQDPSNPSATTKSHPQLAEQDDVVGDEEEDDPTPPTPEQLARETDWIRLVLQYQKFDGSSPSLPLDLPRSASAGPSPPSPPSSGGSRARTRA